eukprot:gene26102-11816_t
MEASTSCSAPLLDVPTVPWQDARIPEEELAASKSRLSGEQWPLQILRSSILDADAGCLGHSGRCKFLGPLFWMLCRLSGPKWPLQILRSSILDADRLDSELITLLKEQFQKIFSLVMPDRAAEMEPELQACLSLMGPVPLGSRSGVEDSAITGPVPLGGRSGVEGSAITVFQQIALGSGYLIIPYLWGKLGCVVYNAERQRLGHTASITTLGHKTWSSWFSRLLARAHIRTGMKHVETAYSAAAAINLLAFLQNGKFSLNTFFPSDYAAAIDKGPRYMLTLRSG